MPRALSAIRSTALRLTVCAAAVLFLADPTSIAAQEDDSSKPASERPLSISYQLWGQQRDAISFDPGDHRRTGLLYQRLRISFDKRTDRVRGVAGADFLTGALAGSTPTVRPPTARTGTSPRLGAFSGPSAWIDPRRAYVEFREPEMGFVKVGLQTSHWGLGLVAHDGAGDGNELFNHYFGGDRYLRALGGFSLLPRRGPGSGSGDLVAAVGGDLVYRDEWAALRAGDRAGRGILAIMRSGRRTRSGTYLTIRDQNGRDGDQLTSFLVDLFAEHLWSAPGGWTFRAGAEGALQAGSRTRFVDADDTRDVGWVGGGAAAEFDANYRPGDVRFRLKTGIASGDSDRDDETEHWFRFDPNYQVGLILFDHYLPAVTRESYRRAVDPARGALPPDYADTLVNDGAVQNAMYVNPMVLFGGPSGWMGGIGVVGARAPKPWSDPAASFDNGGTPTGVSGRHPASRDLGWEIDGSTRYRETLSFDLTLEAKVEFGILFPGEAFRRVSGAPATPVSLLRGSLGAEW